jgi:hypothetical protein
MAKKLGAFIGFFVVTTMISIVLLTVPLAQSQIALVPMMDPQRNNPNKDGLTQAAINMEDAAMKGAYRYQLNGNTAAYNQGVTLNNVFVCFNAAHNNDNVTAQTCDSFMTQTAVALRSVAANQVIPAFYNAVHQYLYLRGIENATALMPDQP